MEGFIALMLRVVIGSVEIMERGSLVVKDRRWHNKKMIVIVKRNKGGGDI